jgi:TrmH RNA methyltransferase
MAANRKAYHVVDEAELAKASGTDHHGGVCFLTAAHDRPEVVRVTHVFQRQNAIFFCGLRDPLGNRGANPHNLGAIMRSCAHFGVKGVVVQDAGVLESGAAGYHYGWRSRQSRSPPDGIDQEY